MMTKGRFEVFIHRVLAIVITIMVLELKVPHGGNFDDLKLLLLVFGSSFLVFLCCYILEQSPSYDANCKACNK